MSPLKYATPPGYLSIPEVGAKLRRTRSAVYKLLRVYEVQKFRVPGHGRTLYVKETVIDEIVKATGEVVPVPMRKSSKRKGK